MAVLCVSLTHNANVILSPYAFTADGEQTYSQILEGMYLASAKDTLNTRFKSPISVSDKTLIKCFVAQTQDRSNSVEVNLGLKCGEGCRLFGSFIHYELKDMKEVEVSSRRNAFDVLMMSSKNLPLEYPPKFGANPDDVARGDYRLHNDFIDLVLRKNEIGFPNGLEKSVGKSVVGAFCDLLFYILPHLSKICARNYNFPELFYCFLSEVETYEQAYNVPEKHKNIARLDSLVLDKKLQGLYDIKMNFSATLSHPRYRILTEALETTLKGVSSYLENLDRTRERENQIHASLQPRRSFTDGNFSQVRVVKGSVRSENEISKYQGIEDALKNVENYEPVFLNDLLPTHRKKRYNFLADLKLPFDIEVYSYHPGSRNVSLWFCWKNSGTNPSQTNACIHKIESSGELPTYHSRAMRKEFLSRYSLVVKSTPSVMTELYQFLTGDQSVMSCQVSKDVQSRLKLLLETQDPDFVYDLRHLNEGRASSFDEFWSEVDKYMNEQAAKAVDDRRHGTVCHSAVAMSVPDLRKVIESRLPENTVIPSVKWMYMQFSPQNPFHKSAIHYTGRFNLKHKVQSRQFSVDHPDAHYAAAIFRYVKEFSVRFRDLAVLLCVDDKAAIPIGEPGVPMASVARGKKTIVQEGIPFLVADHDTATKCKVVPSTILIPDIPESVDGGSFYRGTVCTILKDSVFQPSSPLRHSAEIRKILGITGNLAKPIRIIYSDGGPDHRVTYPSVQLALAGLFLIDDLDVLLAARCCPSRSYTNPAERWHSVMNLALQSVALERSEMEPQFQKVMQRCDTMKAMREAGLKINGFSEAVTDSLAGVMQTLSDLFGRLSLKGRPCIIGKPANDLLLDEIWDAICTLEPVTRNDTTAKSLSGKKKLQEFMTHCTIKRQYFFMIKKCGSVECQICKPLRGTYENDTLQFLPDPVPNPDDPSHYKEFSDVYGACTTEEHRPSLQGKSKAVGVSAKEKGIRICGETVRAVLYCEECDKPRCVYSNKKLSSEQTTSLLLLQEEMAFFCGSKFFPEKHTLSKVCCVLDGVTCTDTVSAHYYSSSTRLHFPPVCFICGLAECLRAISAEDRTNYQSIHPVCEGCFSKGHSERRRGEKIQRGKKRKILN